MQGITKMTTIQNRLDNLDSKENHLEHFGKKGMRWGVRSTQGGSSIRKSNKDAKKDAKEFAAAKMFYGKGAGTRRKLINAKVEARSKKDSNYAKAFKNNLNTQDMAKASDKATKQRKSIDRKEKNKYRAGYVARRLTGEMGTQAAFTAAAFAGAAFLRSSKGAELRNTLVRVATEGMSKLK